MIASFVDEDVYVRLVAIESAFIRYLNLIVFVILITLD